MPTDAPSAMLGGPEGEQVARAAQHTQAGQEILAILQPRLRRRGGRVRFTENNRKPIRCAPPPRVFFRTFDLEFPCCLILLGPIQPSFDSDRSPSSRYLPTAKSRFVYHLLERRF